MFLFKFIIMLTIITIVYEGLSSLHERALFENTFSIPYPKTNLGKLTDNSIAPFIGVITITIWSVVAIMTKSYFDYYIFSLAFIGFFVFPIACTIGAIIATLIPLDENKLIQGTYLGSLTGSAIGATILQLYSKYLLCNCLPSFFEIGYSLISVAFIGIFAGVFFELIIRRFKEQVAKLKGVTGLMFKDDYLRISLATSSACAVTLLIFINNL